MTTHRRPAHDASKLLRSKTTGKTTKRVAASDLAQAPKKKPTPPKGK
jgi:hypothetical protein